MEVAIAGQRKSLRALDRLDLPAPAKQQLIKSWSYVAKFTEQLQTDWEADATCFSLASRQRYRLYALLPVMLSEYIRHSAVTIKRYCAYPEALHLWNDIWGE